MADRRRTPRWSDVHPSRRGLVLTWAAFTATFLISRLVTGVIKLGGENTGNVNMGHVHLHHFLWGILLVVSVAFFGLVDRNPRTSALMGVALGIGLGLIIDELALLVTLRDVYWSGAGWSSVGVAIALIGIAGTVLAFTRSAKYSEPVDKGPTTPRPER
ncbi:MAG TPA: hypothetical protein VGJ14_06995 [Sporichthyaceae bacterium]|jgi:hypothetical protein